MHSTILTVGSKPEPFPGKIHIIFFAPSYFQFFCRRPLINSYGSNQFIMSLRPVSVSSMAILRRSYGTVQSPTNLINNVKPNVLQEATMAPLPRTNWTKDEVQRIYETPMSHLTYAAVGEFFLLAELRRNQSIPPNLMSELK